jgi:NADH-quinone oxidoreductase subunit F
VSTHLLFEGIDEPGLNTLEGYRRRGGYETLLKALRMGRDEVLSELIKSELRGRGGAGFSMGTKASFLPKGDMDKYLVCNADESEPGAFKDRELMHKNPHQLIEGIIIAAYATAATRAFIFIRGEYAYVADILERAVEEAKEAGYLGERVLDSEHDLILWVHRGAGAYICGEETALLDALEGKRGNPRLKPPFPANQGLYQGPTLINNVETLSNVPHILAMGADEYIKIGVQNSTGTKVVSVSGNVQRPGNYEVELGISSRELICDLAGGPPTGREIKFWFPGGSSSPVLTADDLDLPYDFDSMAKAGSMLGSGSIIVVDDSNDVLDVALKVAKFYRHVHAVPRGDELDGEDARAHPARRGHADGPRHHGLGPGADHRQLPVRPGRLDGDADRLDDRQVPRGVRGAHGVGSRRRRPRRDRGGGVTAVP